MVTRIGKRVGRRISLGARRARRVGIGLAGAGLAALGATLLMPTPVLADATVIFVPFSAYFDECNGDTVTLVGGHYVEVDHVNTSNGLQLVFKYTTNGHGTGVTGKSYQVTDSEHDFIDINGRNDQMVESHGIDSHIIGPLQGDNFMLHTLAHATVNANGVPTAYTFTFTPRCQ